MVICLLFYEIYQHISLIYYKQYQYGVTRLSVSSRNRPSYRQYCTFVMVMSCH